MMTYDEGH